jgi:hypothetical protein
MSGSKSSCHKKYLMILLPLTKHKAKLCNLVHSKLNVKIKREYLANNGVFPDNDSVIFSLQFLKTAVFTAGTRKRNKRSIHNKCLK